MATQFLNVLDFGANPNLPPTATQQQLESNRNAIQAAFNAILNPGNASYLDPSNPNRVGATVRIPAGRYRIYGRLFVPFYDPSASPQYQYRQNFSIEGDGRGGQADGGAVNGTSLIQHQNNEPIFEFRVGDTWGWQIKSLGFTWNTPQTQSNAIGILFGGTSSNGYYHGRIDNCYFRNAYGGIRIVNANPNIPVPVWDSHIDNCHFSDCVGASISFSSGIGMPANSISNCFIENYVRDNGEPQIVLSGQSGATLTNLDMEGATGQVIYADSSTLTIDGLHIENLRGAAASRVLLFLGDQSYVVRGLSIAGGNYNPNGPLYLVNGNTGVSIVVIGASANFNPATLTNNVFLFSGPGAFYRLVGRFKTNMPTLIKAYPAEQLAHVVSDPLKTLVNVALGSDIGAGETVVQNKSLVGARIGDIVTVGPPSNFPSRIIPVGLVVSNDQVQLRLTNTHTSSIAVPAGDWTIQSGGGRT